MAAAHLVRIRISNSYSLLSIVPRMKHQWTLQVGLEAQPDSCLPHGAALPDLIKEVRFGLKPAFRILSYGTQSAEEESVPATGYLDVKEAPFQAATPSPVWTCVVLLVSQSRSLDKMERCRKLPQTWSQKSRCRGSESQGPVFFTALGGRHAGACTCQHEQPEQTQCKWRLAVMLTE